MIHQLQRGPGRGRSFVKRIYVPRILGLGFGAFPVGSVLYELNYTTPVWLLMLFCALIWPHIAYIVGLRAKYPYNAEFRNLLFDAAIVGFWIAMMGFNLVPSLLLLSANGLNNISAGGVKFYLKGWGATLIGMCLAFLIIEPFIYLDSSQLSIMICIPLVLIYPLLVGFVTFRLSIKLMEERQHALVLSKTDALSQLNNRGHWESLVLKKFDAGKATNEKPALLMIDIDHFKRINDTHGHLAGDKVLICFAQAMKNFFHGTNAELGRYGGEEFGVLLPDTDPMSAKQVAEAFCRYLAKQELSICTELDIKLTVSIGIALLTPNMQDFSQWIDIADQALYKAKDNGRNQVCLAKQDNRHFIATAVSS
ncbi:diguanylate cyclase [Catenovulum sediminis]|uniref:diguanylate cyclase n=1 Tax=Catenovulum sediminis TaxID=1740262 RepID=A0ABV1RG35_9ALTE